MKTEYSHDDKLLVRILLPLIAVNILSSLIQPCNQFIDSMLTGNGLGIEAMQAYALFFPLGSLVVALSCVFSVGTQINCSHMLGKGEFENSGKLVKTSFLSAAVFSVSITVLLTVLAPQIAVLLGASSDVPGQISDVVSCLRGYAPGIPAIFLMGIMMSLLQLEGRRQMVIALSVVNLTINLLGDIMNLMVFRKGLFGMALATSIANTFVFLILLVYFLFYSRMFRFSLAGFSGSHLRRILKNGFPSLSYYGSLVIRSAFFNYLILTRLNGAILAVLLAVNAFTSVVDAALGGTGDAVLLLGGVLHGEKDRAGQKKLLKTAMISGTVLLLVITAISFAAAVPIASLFSDNKDPEFIAATASAIRLTALSFVPDVIACVLKKYIQSVGASNYTSVTNILCNVVYVCLSAMILAELIGSDGIFLSYLVCYVLILLTHILYAVILSGKNKCRGMDIFLFLPEDHAEHFVDMWEGTVTGLDGCMKVSKDIAALCKTKGLDTRRTYHISLFVEEMTKNIVEHGFRHGKHNLIVIKMILWDDSIFLTIKDNCRSFDPKHYYDTLDEKEDVPEGMGIRLVMKLAKKTVYTNSFNLNNLMIEL